MTLFMDLHQVAGGVAMDDVATAHLADLHGLVADHIYRVQEGS